MNSVASFSVSSEAMPTTWAPGFCSAKVARSGASTLHGGHHEPNKLTTSGLPA